MQHAAVDLRREDIHHRGVIARRRVVRSDVECVRRDGYRRCEVNLLPARSSFVGRDGAGQQRSAVRPQARRVGPNVQRPFVKTNPVD